MSDIKFLEINVLPAYVFLKEAAINNPQGYSFRTQINDLPKELDNWEMHLVLVKKKPLKSTVK